MFVIIIILLGSERPSGLIFLWLPLLLPTHACLLTYFVCLFTYFILSVRRSGSPAMLIMLKLPAPTLVRPPTRASVRQYFSRVEF